MPGTVTIFAGGAELDNWTDFTLSRSKEDLTGSLSLTLFMEYVPGSPVAVSGAVGNEILVYIGNNIAFTGKIDKRTGTGDKHGRSGTKDTPDKASNEKSSGTGSVSIGPNEYSVKFQARGKSKIFVDSSHKHPTGQMDAPTTQDVVNKLVEGTNVSVQWMATAIKLDKVRFRDGATLWEELQRVGNENAYFMYQTRDGQLRVTDDTGRTAGDPLILGDNILTFSAEQSEDNDRKEIKVKGQRIPKDKWGRDAVTTTVRDVTSATSTNEAPITIQHYGDGTPEALERRATFEANKRISSSKTVTIEVFHVQSNGNPWDVGNVHYVEVPPEGLFEAMECTSLEYTVDAKETLRTKLTLAPLPTASVGGGSTDSAFGFGDIANTFVSTLVSFGASRRAQFGVTYQPGVYPASWGSAELSITNPKKSVYTLTTLSSVLTLDSEEITPVRLPISFRDNPA